MSQTKQLFGVKCKPGFGYNAKTGFFTPITQEKIVDFTAKNDIYSHTQIYSMNLLEAPSFTYLYFVDGLCETIMNNNENGYKFMDFLIGNYRKIGWISHIKCGFKGKYYNELANYPVETTHYVYNVIYGLQIFVIFDKKNIQFFDVSIEDDTLGQFLDKIWEKEHELTEEQKNVFCLVLIFSPDPKKTLIQEMKMGEIVQMIYSEKRNFDYEVSITCLLKPLINETKLMKLDFSDLQFKNFANNLFELYWMKKILEEKISTNVQEQREKLKSQLDLINNVWDQRMEQLFQFYGGSKITQNELVSGFLTNELAALKQELCGTKIKNGGQKTVPGLVPQKLEEDGSSSLLFSKESVIMNKNDIYLIKPEMIQKMKMGIYLTNDAPQPYISLYQLTYASSPDSHRKFLLGFASHQNKFTNKKLETSEIFAISCPENCSNDVRQWICIDCGDFFRANGFDVACNCGTTHAMQLKLECFDCNHSKTFPIWHKQDQIR